MRRARIEEQNRYMLDRLRRFRTAADVIGSVARPLQKEVPRFREFRRQRVDIWHECADLDLAVWLDDQGRLGSLRRARDLALRDAGGLGVAGHQVDVFLFEPGSDRYLGRLCDFRECPKGKPDCLVPGCGAVPFNKRVPGFIPRADLLAGRVTLYERGAGRLCSALDLATVEDVG